MKTLQKHLLLIASVLFLSHNLSAQFRLNNVKKHPTKEVTLNEAVIAKKVKLEMDPITILEQQIDSLQNSIDSLKTIRGQKPPPSKLNNRFFYAYNEYNSQKLFNEIYNNTGDKKIKTINTTGFIFGNKNKSVYSELINGYIGGARVSFGSMLTTSNNSEEETKDSISLTDKPNNTAIQQLMANGANMVLKLEYPLFYYSSKDDRFKAIALFQARGGADFPEIGTISDKWAGSFTYGFKSHFIPIRKQNTRDMHPKKVYHEL